MPNVEDEQHIVLPGAPPAHLLKRTMIKDCIGRCRATSYDLPKDIMHVYGYIQEKDKADARECIGGWDQFTPSACSSAQRSFVKTNLEALKAGNITAKSQREYQIANPNIFSAQAKPGHKPDRHNKPPFDGPYGFVPKTGTEPLTHTIEGRYMGQGDDDAFGACTVCFASFEAGDECVRLLCGHVFHRDCVVQWVNTRTESGRVPTCPQCTCDM